MKQKSEQFATCHYCGGWFEVRELRCLHVKRHDELLCKECYKEAMKDKDNDLGRMACRGGGR